MRRKDLTKTILKHGVGLTRMASQADNHSTDGWTAQYPHGQDLPHDDCLLPALKENDRRRRRQIYLSRMTTINVILTYGIDKPSRHHKELGSIHIKLETRPL